MGEYSNGFRATRRCRFCVGSTLENRTTYSPKEQVQGSTSLLSVSAPRCLTQVNDPALAGVLNDRNTSTEETLPYGDVYQTLVRTLTPLDCPTGQLDTPNQSNPYGILAIPNGPLCVRKTI